MTLFTSQSAAMFYDKLFSSLDFTLPRAATGRRGFPKEAMVCAFIVMKCEGFTQITDLMDYLDNNRLIAHYCGFNIMEPLPSYWTYDRCLRQLNNGALKSIMADLVRQLYELGIVDASFIGPGFHSDHGESSAIASFSTSLFASAAKPSFTAISVFFLSDMIYVFL